MDLTILAMLFVFWAGYAVGSMIAASSARREVQYYRRDAGFWFARAMQQECPWEDEE